MRGHRDLTAVSIAGVLCATVAVAVPVEGLRIPAAMPLALLLPGYAVNAAIFARIPLAGPQVLLLSLALSLATLVICSLLLTLTPGGLQEGSWAAALVAVTLGGCYAAAQRRGRPRPGGLPRPVVRIRFADAAFLVGAMAVVGVAAVVAWTPFPANDVVGHTRLWVLPIDERGVVGARVGVGSEEQDTLAYRLELQVGRGRPPSSTRIRLVPGQQRVVRVTLSRASAGAAQPITATLFRLDKPGIEYRQVRSWIPPGRSNQ
jgi:uncharacterized membrane protein